MTPINNLKVEYHNARRGLVSWDDGTTFKYHVWLVDDIAPAEIYKNTFAAYRTPGYRRMQRLDIHAVANAKLWARVQSLLGATAIYKARCAAIAADQAERDADKRKAELMTEGFKLMRQLIDARERNGDDIGQVVISHSFTRNDIEALAAIMRPFPDNL